MSGKKHIKRTICSQVRPAQEYGEEYEERGSGWWDLINDLLMVGACAAVADTFRDATTWAGLGVFALQFSLCQSGWLMYTIHSSRYLDDSLVHSAMLLVYFLGTAGMVVHATGVTSTVDMVGFNAGAALQRGAIVLLSVNAACSSRRARAAGSLDAFFNTLIMGLLALAAVMAHSSEAVLWLWGSITAVEMLLYGQAMRLLGNRAVSLNIDHMSDRNGCLTMVVLGESVVSEAIKYSAVQSPERTVPYYVAMGLGFCLTFSLALWTFHIQPPREMHAYRRSRSHGLALGIVHRFWWIALLALGTGMKHVMAAVTGLDNNNPEPTSKRQRSTAPPTDDGPSLQMPTHEAWLVLGSLAAAFFLLLCIRLLHYGGREPKPIDPPIVYRLKVFWWTLLALWTLLPIACGLVLTSGAHSCDPILVVGSAAACTVSATVVETVIVQCVPPLHKDEDGTSDKERDGGGREEEEEEEEEDGSLSLNGRKSQAARYSTRERLLQQDQHRV